MKVVYIHQYFVLPEHSGATRSYWSAKELIRRGHQVVMITSTNRDMPDAGRKIIDGIDVEYIKNAYDNTMTPVQKIKSFIRFMVNATKAAKKEKNVDIVFATSTPLTIGGIALWLRAFYNMHYVFEVRDLWPEFPIEIGAIRNPLLIKLLKLFEKSIYKKSEHVVTLSPGMQDGVIAVGTPWEKTSMIPNMSKPDLYFPHKPDMYMVEKYKLDLNKFNVIHFGSMGVANGLKYIVDTAAILKNKGINDVCFWFAGSGATKAPLEKRCDNEGLDNVKFLGHFNLKDMAEIVNCSDISITTFLNLPILKTNSPNKLFDSLSAGKPIIVNSAGWTKDMVEKNDCGFYVDPENPQELAEKLIEVKDNRQLLERWGKNARKLSLEVYDKEKLSAQVADVLEDVVANL